MKGNDKEEEEEEENEEAKRCFLLTLICFMLFIFRKSIHLESFDTKMSSKYIISFEKDNSSEARQTSLDQTSVVAPG